MSCVAGLLAATSASRASAQDPEPAAAATVLVHLDGAPDATLEQDTRGDGTWTAICAAPCDTRLPTDPSYRINGDGLRSSSPLHLSARSGDRVTLAVHPAWTGLFVVGIALIPTGVAASIGGAFVIALGNAFPDRGSDPSAPPPPNTAAGTGWLLVGVGAAATVGGILLVAFNSSTSVQQAPGPASGGLALQGDPLRIVPQWREAAPEDAAMPRVTGSPVWTVRF